MYTRGWHKRFERARNGSRKINQDKKRNIRYMSEKERVEFESTNKKQQAVRA